METSNEINIAGLLFSKLPDNSVQIRIKDASSYILNPSEWRKVLESLSPKSSSSETSKTSSPETAKSVSSEDITTVISDTKPTEDTISISDDKSTEDSSSPSPKRKR